MNKCDRTWIPSNWSSLASLWQTKTESVPLQSQPGNLTSNSTKCKFHFPVWLTSLYLRSDHFQNEAIEVLENAGIELKRHAKEGIKKEAFSSLFKKSNLVNNSSVTWVAFNARYDFGYLLHLLDLAPLPFNENTFIKKCTDAFGKFFDVKLLRDDKGSLHQQLKSEHI